MHLLVERDGAIRCLYSEVLDLHRLGSLVIDRASLVEPDEVGRWWADLTLVGGPVHGPFTQRSEAISAEVHWLETNWLLA